MTTRAQRLAEDRAGLAIVFRETERNPEHVRIAVWIGKNEGSRGHAGMIVMRVDEWEGLLGGRVRRFASWGPVFGGDAPNTAQVWFREDALTGGNP